MKKAPRFYVVECLSDSGFQPMAYEHFHTRRAALVRAREIRHFYRDEKFRVATYERTSPSSGGRRKRRGK